MRISDWSSDVCSSDLFKNGNFDRVKPIENFGQGGLGAWELAIRHDSADLSETPTARAGNKAHSWTAGLNWYWNPNMKLQFNYIRFSGDNTPLDPVGAIRSEEHTSELQSLMRISYAVFCLKKTNHKTYNNTQTTKSY